MQTKKRRCGCHRPNRGYVTLGDAPKPFQPAFWWTRCPPKCKGPRSRLATLKYSGRKRMRVDGKMVSVPMLRAFQPR